MATPGDKEHDRLDELLAAKIENLRPKLLDLTRRNPLVSTPLTGRATSYIRVVDELPDVLCFELERGQTFRLASLPPLEDEPADEGSEEFLALLSEARHTDAEYAAQLSDVDPSAEDASEAQRLAERDLRDRLREQLGMAPRQTKEGLSVQQHARNHKIDPAYDLPKPDQEHDDGRHTDDAIQTLLLPDPLERAAGRLLQKANTWVQETGLNVLQAAFGCLEWAPPNETRHSFSPLVLLPLSMERSKGPSGAIYKLRGAGEPAEMNHVLAEKLRLEHGVELPTFEGGSIEAYLETVADAAPPGLAWRVRRYVTIGVFPSSRMAMYHDLDTSAEDFAINDAVSTLLGGTPSSGAESPFAPEYEVDAPHIEAKVAGLVSDADSSQFSVLVDLAENKNLAVEGPPGTGKSQTIVNAIAAAMGEGKKVLFVAEKTAALNVVRSRLEALGLGEFLLPLQAERASRDQVVQSLRDRLELGTVVTRSNHEKHKALFQQSRAEIDEYIQLLNERFAESDMSVRDVLTKAAASAPVLEALPQTARRPQVSSAGTYTKDSIEHLKEKAEYLESVWRSAQEAEWFWQGCQPAVLTRVFVESLLERVRGVAEVFEDLVEKRRSLEAFDCPADLPLEEIKRLGPAVAALSAEAYPDIDRLRDASVPDRLSDLKTAIDALERHLSRRSKLSEAVTDPDRAGLPAELERLAELCLDHDFESASPEAISELVEKDRRVLDGLTAKATEVKAFLEEVPELGAYDGAKINRARALVEGMPPGVLALRATIPHDPANLAPLEGAAANSRALRADRERLSHLFDLGQRIRSAEVAKAAATLRSAGFLARFGADFRTAKTLFRQITQRPSAAFKPAAAARELSELADWKRKVEMLENDSVIAAACGEKFQGLDTDFDSILALFGFYQRVDEELPGIDQRALRRFLKSADSDLLHELPEPGIGSRYSLSEIDRELDERAQLLGEQEKAASEIDTLAAQLREPSQVSQKRLTILAAEVEAYQTERDGLNDLAVCRWMGALTGSIDQSLIELRKILKGAELAVACGPFKAQALEAVRSNTADSLVTLFDAIDELTAKANEALEAVCSDAGIEPARFADLTPDEAAQALKLASADSEGFMLHARVQDAVQPFRDLGLGWFIDDLLAESRGLNDLSEAVEAMLFQAFAIELSERYGPELRRFTGQYLDDAREKFAKRDRKQIISAREFLAQRIANTARPPSGRDHGRVSEYTQLGLIRHECSKSKRHVSVRELVKRAGDAMQELKPCWMMSPLAVAQYIPKGSLKFDLCIIDEASQMPPENALGALFRCDQVMVVGDTNQLPPTSFFQKLIEDEDADEDESVVQESVLEMANGAFRPARRLRWHYRSRHSGLISFSNRHIYEDDLIVFPSASEDRADQGVSLVQVAGTYKSGVNTAEAHVMVQAALDFMRRQPHRSLGLVTLNQKQRDLIQEELQYALDRDAAASRYVERWREHKDGLEELFVKNLENVQGDERDVIFIGTVYGPERQGARVHQRFGPINGLAGRRRLNVLFSRAKEQTVTFSSMTAADILADETGNQGAFMLKCWLEYCATSHIERGTDTKKDYDSDFEEFVAQQIRSMGFEAVPQVGVAGYFVDLGVRHPEWPYGYVLGVECDGAAYHSSKSARDRDRLRQEVLEGLGWRFHRIWSTDWFEDPRREAANLRNAIERRVQNLKGREDEFRPAPQPESWQQISLDLSTADEELGETEAEISRELEPSSPNGPGGSSEGPPAPIGVDEEAYNASCGASVGDQVRVTYLDGDQATLVVVLSEKPNDPESGIVNINMPLGKALLGAEEDMEIEVLAGYRIRRARVEHITKP